MSIGQIFKYMTQIAIDEIRWSETIKENKKYLDLIPYRIF